MLKNLKKILYIALINLSLSISVIASPNFTLQDLIDIAKRENPILDVLKAKEDAARSSVVTA